MDSSLIDTRTIYNILEQKCDFLIPSYQRGYRWVKKQVTELLSDILEFHQSDPSSEEFYCLQPVVLKKVSGKENLWEVIDGQQRLTTIYIILTYIHSKTGSFDLSFSINYETRPNSRKYLESISDESSKELADDNIDYYHMHQAYQCVREWFAEQSHLSKRSEVGLVNNILTRLLDQTRFIWYVVPNNADSIKIFTRLNMGKIPLDNAELIKALFLRRDNFTSGATSTDDAKLSLHLKQIEIANDWDRMEYALQEDSFWYFLANGTPGYEGHISFILDMMARSLYQQMNANTILKDDPYFSFLVFNQLFQSMPQQQKEKEHQISQLWLKIKECYLLLDEWFRDRTIYHLIGYLVTSGESIFDIWQQAQGKRKSEFLEYLNRKIKSTIREVGDINDLNLEYPAHKKSIRKILLLFNIISLQKNPHSEMRFPFDSFKKEEWDLEHIHALKSKPPLAPREQESWLQMIVEKAGESIDCKEAEEAIEIANKKPISKEDFLSFFNRIVSHYGDEDEIDGIGNLTLLDKSTNRSYKNNIFPIKRMEIINRDQSGTFIPLCTRNVFLKYYSHNPDNYVVWTEEDQQNYIVAIEHVLADYLPVREG